MRRAPGKRGRLPLAEMHGLTTDDELDRTLQDRRDLVLAWRIESALARFLIIATPQHEDFYRECCTPAPAFIQPPDAGQIDLSIISPAGRRHGVQIISPPPTY